MGLVDKTQCCFDDQQKLYFLITWNVSIISWDYNQKARLIFNVDKSLFDEECQEGSTPNVTAVQVLKHTEGATPSVHTLILIPFIFFFASTCDWIDMDVFSVFTLMGGFSF